MMNPRLGMSLTRASTALQVLSILLFLMIWLMGVQSVMTGAMPGAVMNFVWLAFGLPIPLWFVGLCGKVLADLHGYCYWAQENAMAREGREQSPTPAQR